MGQMTVEQWYSTIKTGLTKKLTENKEALPAGFNQQRFILNCITVIQDMMKDNKKKEQLEKINPETIPVCLAKAAYLGLDFFNGECYAIPYGGTQIVESVDSSMSELEAWSLVRKAVRNSGYHSVEEFEKLPEACQRAVGSAANLKEWALMDSERVETVEQSHFIRNYRTTVQRISEEKKLPESIRLLIASMRDNALELEKKEQPVLEVKKQEEEKTDPEPGMSEETRAKFQQVMRNLQGKM